MAPPHRSQRLSMPAPEEYFRGVSPLCRRILEDMARIRESYGEQWQELTYDEQCKILDQTIVDEATVRRYETGDMAAPECEYFPKLKLSTGQKIVSDEKLSARGYTCSWRDEHSAPFSWHTRSQMDLTLDTPPPTPTQSATKVSPLDYGDDKVRTSSKEGISSLGHSVTTFKASPFLWHYEPQHDLKPPDPPDLVIASTLKRDNAKGFRPLIPQGTSFSHVVVRGERERFNGLLGWFRNAIGSITGTCLPIHSCTEIPGHNLHPSSPFIHPELRPPHVIAKAAKISIPTMSQPKTSSKKSDSCYLLSNDATLKSECPSTETTFTYDVTSDKGSHVSDDIMKGCPNQTAAGSRLPLCNRNSLIYGTFTEEEMLCHEDRDSRRPRSVGAMKTSEFSTVIETRKNNTQNDELVVNKGRQLLKEEECPKKTDEPDNFEDDFPLISLSTTNAMSIPKTGFDFLDNW